MAERSLGTTGGRPSRTAVRSRPLRPDRRGGRSPLCGVSVPRSRRRPVWLALPAGSGRPVSTPACDDTGRHRGEPRWSGPPDVTPSTPPLSGYESVRCRPLARHCFHESAWTTTSATFPVVLASRDSVPVTAIDRRADRSPVPCPAVVSWLRPSCPVTASSPRPSGRGRTLFNPRRTCHT